MRAHDAVLEYLRAGGEDGATTTELARALGLRTSQTRLELRALRRAGAAEETDGVRAAARHEYRMENRIWKAR